MKRAELLDAIKNHEASCLIEPGAGFGVAAVRELADGVLAVQETDGEHIIYFDQTRFRVKKGSAFEDISAKIRSFPPGVGFMEDVMARNWASIARTVKLAIEPVKGGKVKWHPKPAMVKYR